MAGSHQVLTTNLTPMEPQAAICFFGWKKFEKIGPRVKSISTKKPRGTETKQETSQQMETNEPHPMGGKQNLSGTTKEQNYAPRPPPMPHPSPFCLSALARPTTSSFLSFARFSKVFCLGSSQPPHGRAAPKPGAPELRVSAVFRCPWDPPGRKPRVEPAELRRRCKPPRVSGW